MSIRKRCSVHSAPTDMTCEGIVHIAESSDHDMQTAIDRIYTSLNYKCDRNDYVFDTKFEYKTDMVADSQWSNKTYKNYTVILTGMLYRKTQPPAYQKN